MASDVQAIKKPRSLTPLIRNHFDLLSAAYYEVVDETPFLYGYYHVKEAQILLEVLQNVNQTLYSTGTTTRILDVGCASGRLIRKLRRNEASDRFIGLDLSPAMIKLARNSAQAEQDFVVGDIRHLPFHDELFDLTYSMEVLEHLENREVGIPSAISEIARVAKPGGVSVVESTSTLYFRIREVVSRILSLSDTQLYVNAVPSKYRRYYAQFPVPIARASSLPYITGILKSNDLMIISVVWVRVIPELLFLLFIGKRTRKFLSSIDKALERIPSLRYLGREFIVVARKRHAT